MKHQIPRTRSRLSAAASLCSAIGFGKHMIAINSFNHVLYYNRPVASRGAHLVARLGVEAMITKVSDSGRYQNARPSFCLMSRLT